MDSVICSSVILPLGMPTNCADSSASALRVVAGAVATVVASVVGCGAVVGGEAMAGTAMLLLRYGRVGGGISAGGGAGCVAIFSPGSSIAGCVPAACSICVSISL